MAAERGSGGNVGGIGLGGILVIVGIIVMLVWSFLLGLIITLVGSLRSADSRRASGTETQTTGPGADRASPAVDHGAIRRRKSASEPSRIDGHFSIWNSQSS